MASEPERELRRYLEGIDFAASQEDLVSMAMHNDAPEELLDELEELPRKEYEDLEEVVEAIKDLREEQ
ncbi:MAG TPA: DUF2795 domain-containing protein [Rubrobacteraceae bacterium]|nr:DUF2795 domain-containing protein [Rubrobacteraceae bacterium]